MVGSNAHGPSKFTAAKHEGRKSLMEPFQFLLVLRVGILSDLELLAVRVVSRINPNLLNVLGGLHGGPGGKMNVRDEGGFVTGGAHFSYNRSKGLGRRDARGRYADDLTTCLGELQGLPDGCLDVQGVGGRHGLDADGVLSSNGQVSDPYRMGLPADGVITRGAVGGRRSHFDSLRKDSPYVEESDVEHEGEEQDDEKDLSPLEKGKGQGFSAQFLHGGEEHVPTIEDGYGKEVENG